MLLYISLIFLLFPALDSVVDEAHETESIQVNFEFNKPCQGQVLISCFQNVDNFLNSEKAIFSEIVTCQDSVFIEGLNPNLSRAVVAFVDLNENKELDLNLFGIPTEPYAISNGFRGKWREPKFEDAAEQADSKEITLDFKYWNEK